MEKRFNPNNGKLEVKLQAANLPPIWVSTLCNRCEKFKECLGFKELTEEQWEQMNNIITNTNKLSRFHQSRYVKTCEMVSYL